MKTHEQTLDKIRAHLKTLKLTRMDKELDAELSLAVKEKLPPSLFLERMLALEAADLVQRRMERRIVESKLPQRKLLAYLSAEVLLIDELGFDRLEQESARNASLFFKVIDGRYTKASTIVTTNVDFKDLGDYLGDPVVTTAIVDRMIHHSVIISIWRPDS